MLKKSKTTKTRNTTLIPCYTVNSRKGKYYFYRIKDALEIQQITEYNFGVSAIIEFCP
jgi:hypothetical protein